MNCKICGKENCKKHSFLLGKKVKIQEFSGSSPPEIFVGKWNYPDVYTGILSPQEYGNTKQMSSPEIWQKNKLEIPEILKLRNQLIYARTQSNIRKLDTKFHDVMKEVAMTHKSISAQYVLKKPISANLEQDNKVPLINHAAQVDYVKLEENASVKPRVDYLVNDKEVKSAIAINELYNSGIDNSSIIKILSAGLLGLKKNRKMVPTRWSITAVDDTLSKENLERIRFYPEIQTFKVFTAEYLGNHYEFLLLPDKWSFEVIEISQKSLIPWHDYESFFPRKKYAESVTGAYYANRLALTEYLEKTKKQCSCIVMREVRPEYYAPLGVGILRQTSREAFSLPGREFSSLKEALDDIQSRLRINISNYTLKSVILKEYGKQQKLSNFF
jgi:hypothetical protein